MLWVLPASNQRERKKHEYINLAIKINKTKAGNGVLVEDLFIQSKTYIIYSLDFKNY